MLGTLTHLVEGTRGDHLELKLELGAVLDEGPEDM